MEGRTGVSDMDDAQAQQTNPLFGIIPKEFLTPLASPNRLV